MHDERGREVPDPIPVEVPLHFRRPPTLQEEIQKYVRREMSLAAEAQGMESFEEADDFDVEDEDGVPSSMYQLTPMQEERIKERPQKAVKSEVSDGKGTRETDGGGRSGSEGGAKDGAGVVSEGAGKSSV